MIGIRFTAVKGANALSNCSVSLVLFLGMAFSTQPTLSQAECSGCFFDMTGNIPLNDLGPGNYTPIGGSGNFQGGLYPNGKNQRPAAYEADGVYLANQIAPLDAEGNRDNKYGKIVLLSVGYSNTTQEFGGRVGTQMQAFKPRIDLDNAKEPRVVVVDGAQGGKDAFFWRDVDNQVWDNVNDPTTGRLALQGVTPQQVQAVWLNEAQATSHVPVNVPFPDHALLLQNSIEQILRNLHTKYPNCRLVYLAPRTYAYTYCFHSPEPKAYETGFADKWVVEDQILDPIGSQLNYDPNNGPVDAPYTSWGPYTWADGVNERSDGLVWNCSDFQDDFVHPSPTGVEKVANQLIAFFMTDPTATPWFLKRKVTGLPPVISSATATVTSVNPYTVQFSSTANDPDGTSLRYMWTFDGGDYAYSTQNPIKLFPAPGNYNVHLTVLDEDGNHAQRTVPVTVP